MNKRIKQLAAQCTSEVANVPCVGHDGWTMMCKVNQIDPDKFAELIIKETMQVVANNVAWNGYLNAADAVIKHFEAYE